MQVCVCVCVNRVCVGVRAQLSGGLFLVQKDAEHHACDRGLGRSAVVDRLVSVLCVDPAVGLLSERHRDHREGTCPSRLHCFLS